MRGNFDNLATTETRKQALRILEAGLSAINTESAIQRDIAYEPKTDVLTIQGNKFSLQGYESVVLIGFGKAAFDACHTLYAVLSGRIKCGFVVDLKGGIIGNLTCSVGSHPFPTEVNVRATQEIKTFLHTLTEKDLVLCVVSGGGSSLLCDPYQMTCEMQTLVVRALMHKGADIVELNTVRKHLDNVKGGQLATAAYPAKVINLVFSDVPPGDLSLVASGPTMYDETTLADASKILAKYGILDVCKLPRCELVETPKDPKLFEKIENFLLVSAEIGIKAMQEKAEDLGFKTYVGDLAYDGEARELGQKFLEKNQPGMCGLWAGESTVTVKVPGKGGRNLELALASLPYLREGQLLLAMDSDGFDNTPFAGALVDSDTKVRAKQLGLDPKLYLEQNNSYLFFENVGDFLDTGLTGANVADLVVVLN